LLNYFLLPFVISWGGILILVLPGELPMTSAELDTLFGPVFGVILLGPSLSSLVLTWALDGRGGIRVLFGAFAKWRVGGGYYLLALLTAPVIVLATTRFGCASQMARPERFELPTLRFVV
jgi:uncharacterized protein